MKIAAVLQVAGIVTAAVGVALVSIAAGVIVAGVGAVLFGVALERGLTNAG
jgi:hypothetical protein